MTGYGKSLLQGFRVYLLDYSKGKGFGHTLVF
jgi:hypothetical protein